MRLGKNHPTMKYRRKVRNRKRAKKLIKFTIGVDIDNFEGL